MADFVRGCLFRSLSALLMLYSPAANAQQTVFPLRVAENHRYLKDAAGRPFLITGDTAWSLIGDLSRADADMYLADRQRRGFNTILVNLIEHRFSRNAPRNFYDQAPFEANAAFSKPNDAYFNDADWILQRARERGFLVLLTPAYMGVNGGSEGWYKEMTVAGPEAVKSYGRYLGQRFRKYDNIIWVQGGDFDPPDGILADALAEGIAETDRDALQTFHASRDTDVALNWRGTPWLDLDTIYTYGDVAEKSLLRYITGPVSPFFLIEGIYEGEQGATAQTVRGIAYSAILSGACGQIFGNNPIWHFYGPGVHEQFMSWPEALSSPGSQSMTHLKEFFDGIDWWRLEPDQGKLLAAENGAAPGYAIGSRSPDGSLAVIYLFGRHSVELNKNALSPSLGARWFDPASGGYTEAVRKTADQRDTVEFETPRKRNFADNADWILVLADAG
ncbi:apiosidase-like domain-containing protein [Inquilinus sp. OTU3971]|uniref:apiosidase-like domain-containing protein n=1 Tax=Inquilinus sp. OTU3971 TaxID=3043855 RepID=UPI00313C8027